MKILTKGLGTKQGLLAVYIEHEPPLSKYKNSNIIQYLEEGELNFINDQCGNGWRKVFNVYAKFLFNWQHPDHNFTNFKTWQEYRDKQLLQAQCQEALLFSRPQLKNTQYKYHIIAGRMYAKKILSDHNLTNRAVWLDNEFAIVKEHKMIVCPYFDYRQLNNSKIEKLSDILKSLNAEGLSC